MIDQAFAPVRSFQASSSQLSCPRFPGFRIQGDQAPVESTVQNSTVVSCLALPVGNPTVLEELPRSRASGLRIKLPYLLTAFRIERNHTIGRSGEVKHTINHDWRGFEWRNVMPVRFVASAVHLPHVIRPRPFQVLNVLTIDLLEWRGPRSAGVTAIKSPLLCARGW